MGRIRRCRGCRTQRQDIYFGRDKNSHYCTKCREKRQSDILRLIACGMTDRQIASALHISEKMVERALVVIHEDTMIYNRTLLGFYAFAKGIVSKEDIQEAIRKERRR